MAVNDTPTNYCRIDSAGKLYTTVDADTPGAVAVKLKDGSTTHRLFRKWNSTITGKFKRPYFKEVTFSTGPVQMIYFFIENEVETDCLSFQLFNAHGGLNSYVKSISQIIKQLDPEREYYIRPSTKMKKNGYVAQSLFITDAETKEWVKLSDEEFKARPEPIVKKRADGKNIYDFTEQDTYVYEALKAGIDAVFGPLPTPGPEDQNYSGAPDTTSYTPPVQETRVPVDDNPDELPF